MNKQLEYYYKNRERYLDNFKKYYIQNKERLKLRRRERYSKIDKNISHSKWKDYYEKNKKRIIIKSGKNAKKRYWKDEDFRAKMRLKARLKIAFNEYLRKGRIVKSKDYGINYEAIIEHLKPFPTDLSKYHIDHIKPLCSFDLINPEEIKKAFAPENHQWLTAQDNLRKVRLDIPMKLRRDKNV